MKMEKRAYYLVEHGKIGVEAKTIIFTMTDKQKKVLPIMTMKSLHVIGNISVSKAAIELLSEHQVALYFQRGNTCFSSLQTDENTHNGATLVEQVLASQDATKKRAIAKAIIEMSVKRMWQVIQYEHKYHPLTTELYEQTKACYVTTLAKLKHVKQVEHVLLIEANWRKHYYACWDQLLQGTDFPFEKRSKQPPKNAVNALISFGNTVIYQRLTQYIDASRLDNRIGFLHATENRRTTTLNLDLSELFKPLLVDRVIFKVLHQQVLDQSHFEVVANGGIYLTKAGCKIFLQALNHELTLKRTIAGEKVTYSQLMQIEVVALQRALETHDEYQPIELKV